MKQILFNTDMVRAILDDRKTETRRAIKPQPDKEHIYPLGFCICGEKKNIGRFRFGTEKHGGNIFYAQPPCGIGDILYVRETWAQPAKHTYWYKADCKVQNILWRPSIHMPQEAARIFLQVTDVRVEKLQKITIQDAIKEGIRAFGCDPCLEINGRCIPQNPSSSSCGIDEIVEEKFIELWDSTIPKKKMAQYGWDANPWVWTVEFKRIEKPMEEQET